MSHNKWNFHKRQFTTFAVSFRNGLWYRYWGQYSFSSHKALPDYTCPGFLLVSVVANSLHSFGVFPSYETVLSRHIFNSISVKQMGKAKIMLFKRFHWFSQHGVLAIIKTGSLDATGCNSRVFIGLAIMSYEPLDNSLRIW